METGKVEDDLNMAVGCGASMLGAKRRGVQNGEVRVQNGRWRSLATRQRIVGD